MSIVYYVEQENSQLGLAQVVLKVPLPFKLSLCQLVNTKTNEPFCKDIHSTSALISYLRCRSSEDPMCPTCKRTEINGKIPLIEGNKRGKGSSKTPSSSKKSQKKKKLPSSPKTETDERKGMPLHYWRDIEEDEDKFKYYWSLIEISGEHEQEVEIIMSEYYKHIKNFLPPECRYNYRQIEYIHRGKYGYAYKVCDKKENCDRILKVAPFVYKSKESDFVVEAEFSALMGKHNIGPIVYDYWLCPMMMNPGDGKRQIPGGLIVMKSYEMNFLQYVEKIKKLFEEKSTVLNPFEMAVAKEKYKLILQGAKEKLIGLIGDMGDIEYINPHYNWLHNSKNFVITDVHTQNIVLNTKKEHEWILGIDEIVFIDFDGNFLENWAKYSGETVTKITNMFNAAVNMFTTARIDSQ